MTHIAVLGSTNMDLVAYVEKAPQRGETVTGREFRTIPGGKGANQAISPTLGFARAGAPPSARAGAAVSMIGAVGNDAFGTRLRATLEHSGVDTGRLRTTEGPSGTAHIVVDDEGGNAIVVIAAADALLLQLEVPLAGVTAGAEAARAHGVRTILTPAPARPLPPELLAAVDLLVPNEPEAAALTGVPDPRGAALALLDRVPEVVITLGAAGSLHAARGTEPLTVPAPRVKAVDSTGAGDTFVGALGEGRPMPQALRWAAPAAALSVQREGASASMPSRQEIEAGFTS
ncbi:Ribokinase [Streptomyces sp. enrichment culture]|uniref:ribokinase n=1 Tax=Streptomyces sp. enrichment culture TaxID=1795815 RepID=UPI003F579DC9